jgi:uncharacterized pyridoxamine 5'-phosphate oxidase family protein
LTGQAIADGNLKKKVFDAEKLYVVNHENDSIYNDITKFPKTSFAEAFK